MSTTSKIVFGVSVLFSAGVVVGVHVKQRLDRERLHEGVIRDLERQAQKKANLLQLEEQIALTKELKREQKQLAESENC
ncbi:protein PET117 homolog, mitochondrial [Erpetoichthys calabaricus]|uniref:protein PET117 homolog, mitochondrial n=1 Tax=Erpetoichthys calabaricus TaxID=27687 RepID=UPI00109F6FB7|nr:protein PET117 homolog, mitochondrial [Erpetoichthys calabaricus]